VQVRVYHRKNGNETWGWYSASPLVDATAFFDGTQIRVAGLTATFDADAARWTGKWLLGGQTRDVVLERPRSATGSSQNPLCGDWEGVPETPRGFGSTTLHIVQSLDGTLRAWMDRTIAPIDQRAESLRIDSADPSNLILALESPTGLPRRFTGVLSSDGNSITGRWNGLNARDSFRRLR
jgi:hypothetical protein